MTDNKVDEVSTETENVAKNDAIRAIVVEDETLIRLDIIETLKDAGFDVVAEGSNGEEAIELAAEHEPDLIVMDVKMPGMDGLTAAERINNKQRCAIVMLTAFSQKRSSTVPRKSARWRSSSSRSPLQISFLR